MIEQPPHKTQFINSKTIKDEDLQFSLEEQYLELKNKVVNQTSHYVVIDFIDNKRG